MIKSCFGMRFSHARDDSSRDELIFRGSYADNAIPVRLSVLKNNSKRHRRRASAARDGGSRDAH